MEEFSNNIVQKLLILNHIFIIKLINLNKISGKIRNNNSTLF